MKKYISNEVYDIGVISEIKKLYAKGRMVCIMEDGEHVYVSSKFIDCILSELRYENRYTEPFSLSLIRDGIGNIDIIVSEMIENYYELSDSEDIEEEEEEVLTIIDF